MLSPESLNAAYYEHGELARLMESPLVTGEDLFASHRGCWRRDGAEGRPVSAIYHRFSPDYLDPLVGFPGRCAHSPPSRASAVAKSATDPDPAEGAGSCLRACSAQRG